MTISSVTFNHSALTLNEDMDVTVTFKTGSKAATGYSVSASLRDDSGAYVRVNGSYTLYWYQANVSKKLNASTTYTVNAIMSPRTWNTIDHEIIMNDLAGYGSDYKFTLEVVITTINSSSAMVEQQGYNAGVKNIYKEYTAPVITTATLSDASNHTAKFGAYIATQTNIVARLAWTCQDGVNATGRLNINNLSFGLQNGINKSIGPMLSAGTMTVTFTVTTPNGKSATVTRPSITVLPYSPPRVTSYSAERVSQNVDNEWIPTDDGNRLWHNLSGSVSTYSGGNAYTISIYAKKDGNSSYTKYSFGGGTGVTQGNINLVNSFGPNDAWQNIEIDSRYDYSLYVEITDWFGNSSGNVYSSTGVLASGALFNIEDSGVGVGMTVGGVVPSGANEGRFDCAYPAYFHNGIKVGGVNIGIIDHGVTSEITVASGKGDYETHVTFNRVFSSIPAISITIDTGTVHRHLTASIYNLSTSGFDISLQNDGTSSATAVIRWLAMQL